MKIDEIVDQIDNATEKFNKTVDIAQSRLLREVLALTKDLATKDGRIMPTVDNLKTINAIRNKISKIVVNKDYAKAVKDLMKSFETVQSSQIDYFRGQFDAGKLSQKYDLVRQLAIENTAQQLTQSGLDANVTSGIKNMLVRSVVSGGQYGDLVGQLNEYLTDTDKGSGALTKYAKTYASTSLSQFAGETNKLLVQDFSPKWFRYVGSNKETTREWCEHMTAKEWVHVSEFDELVRGEVDGKKVEIYERTGLPKGMIDGTDAENLIINRGGWGCQHQFYAVDERIVPENIKAKFKDVK